MNRRSLLASALLAPLLPPAVAANQDRHLYCGPAGILPASASIDILQEICSARGFDWEYVSDSFSTGRATVPGFVHDFGWFATVHRDGSQELRAVAANETQGWVLAYPQDHAINITDAEILEERRRGGRELYRVPGERRCVERLWGDVRISFERTARLGTARWSVEPPKVRNYLTPTIPIQRRCMWTFTQSEKRYETPEH